MQGSSAEQDSTAAGEKDSLSPANKKLILFTALGQGLALYLLKALPAAETWSPVWLYLCYTVVIAIPPLIIITAAPRLAHSFWWIIAGFTLVLALIAGYRGYQCTPEDLVYCEWPRSFAIAIVIATFIVAFLLRAGATDRERLRRPDYPALFHYSWDNALTAGLTLVFTGIFWLILFLWQALFKLVGVQFFRELFEEDWFVYPVTWLVAGSGAILFRSQHSFVLTLKRLLRTMLVALLPLLAVLTIVFLATLPFTGLQPIWDTGHGSALLLWLVALLLFFTNGVIQDEFPFARYPGWINRLLLLALAIAPFYAAFAVYGLILRVQQYGWTPERLWGFVAAATLALLALAYSLAILRRGGQWAAWLPRINTGLALWVLAICLITQTPLLNFWQISAHSQLARLDQGRAELAEFDFFFLRQKLGRPGHDALRSLRQQPAVAANTQLARYVDELLAAEKTDWSLRENPLRSSAEQRQLQAIPVLPSGAELPEALDFHRHGEQCERESVECVWLVQDLDGDGTQEYLLFIHTTQDVMNTRWLRVVAFQRDGDQLKRISNNEHQTDADFTSLRERLSQGPLQLRPGRWQRLYAGDKLLFDPTGY